MMDLDAIFAAIVGTLAALAVIGALVFVIVAEFVAIRAKLVAHRQQTSSPQDGAEDFWRGRAVTMPGTRKW
jgi:hypothetical protein